MRLAGRDCPECGYPPASVKKKRPRPTKQGYWENKKTTGAFLVLVEKGVSDAAACRQVGWSPATFSLWKRWVEYGVDSGGRKVKAPPALLQFIKEYEAARDGLYLKAVDAANSLVESRDRHVVMRALARSDRSWREDVGVEVSGRLDGELSLGVVRSAVRVARSVSEEDEDGGVHDG